MLGATQATTTVKNDTWERLADAPIGASITISSHNAIESHSVRLNYSSGDYHLHEDHLNGHGCYTLHYPPRYSMYLSELAGMEGCREKAICGFSIKFPGEATSPTSFWDMLMEKKCAMSEFPASRLGINGFYREQKTNNSLTVRGGHFIEEDLSAFDANMFSLSPTEAGAADPMQRWLLETTYRAIENAGMSIESISGSSTSVYTGCFGSDYMLQLYRDAEQLPSYGAIGIGLSMLANRISWFFNLRGPSITMDSACSSSLMALDIACQALRARSCNMSIVAGCNLTYAPEIFSILQNISFLSPDSKCYSFDHRANGYARGEGIAVVVLKRLSDAIDNGDTIRAIIRSTGCNEDGRTPGITQPSIQAQEQLIRETYKRSGLSLAHTRYVEAHGTGTSTGDLHEAQAIGSVFRQYRSPSEPMNIGAVKSNIGHLEGASGLAGLIKAVMVLEKGIMPPNANFEKLNNRIDAEYLRLNFLTNCQPWPTRGLRRASVNSFGYGGANSHVVVDDAFNYLRLRGLVGIHVTNPDPCDDQSQEQSLSEADRSNRVRLYVWSSADKDGTVRMANNLQSYASQHLSRIQKDGSFMCNLAYTLDSRRSHLSHRSFALLQSPSELLDLAARITPSQQVSHGQVRVGFVFTGQGAQWFAMGRELLDYPSFRTELERGGRYLNGLGCGWSVLEELSRCREESKMDHPEMSQTITTLVQIAMVNLLRTFGLRPSAVIGHSSGEIAAAFAGGYISTESAWNLAYFRGLCVAGLKPGSNGAMMSVGLSEEKARQITPDTVQNPVGSLLSIACINSPNNVTLSGDETALDKLKLLLDEQNVFTRKLRVGVAYHSPLMEPTASRFESMIGRLERPPDFDEVPMISTVTGERVEASRLLEPSYWALNMISPVRFSQALATLCAQSDAHLRKKLDRSHIRASVVHHLLEVGPHCALQGPIRDILRICPRGEVIGYSSVLRRNCPANQTLLEALGGLYCMGYPIRLRAINEQDHGPSTVRSMIVDLPEYPFNHESQQRFWHEGRLSRNYRLRHFPPSELLGVRSRDWDPEEPRWTFPVRTTEMSWAEQHIVHGKSLYPAAGMLVMAIEAARQVSELPMSIKGFKLRDVHIIAPIGLNAVDRAAPEIQTALRKRTSADRYHEDFEFKICTCNKNNEWVTNCRGHISVELSQILDEWIDTKTALRMGQLCEEYLAISSMCDRSVDSSHMYKLLKQAGFEYGPLFQAANQQHCSHSGQAIASISLFKGLKDQHIIHPVSLDAVFHLAYTALTQGASLPAATFIPHRIGSLWISSQRLSWPSQETVLAIADISKTNVHGFWCRGAALDQTIDPPEISLWYDDLEMRNVYNIPTTALAVSNPKQFCMQIDCKVALSKLDSKQIGSLLEELQPTSGDSSSFLEDLELTVRSSLTRLMDSVDIGSLEESWKRHYWHWAEHHLSQPHSTRQVTATAEPLDELLQRLRLKGHIGALYAEVSSKLVDIFENRYDPTEWISSTDQLKNYYEEITTSRSSNMFRSYLDLLAHQTPGMNILEIGGGTGSGTRIALEALRSRLDNSTYTLRCNKYEFTDISPAFLGTARAEFEPLFSQLEFKILDIGCDFVAQGCEQGHYDVILAVSAIHITPNLKQTLESIRKVLRTNGKLIMLESFEPSGWTLGFVFGLFSGWWAGADEGRSLSPNIDLESWDNILKDCGFSGTDLVLQDDRETMAHRYGWIVTTATDPESKGHQIHASVSYEANIIIDEHYSQQREIADDLVQLLNEVLQIPSTISTMNIVPGGKSDILNRLDIFLADYGASYLESMQEADFSQLQSLMRNTTHLLWVSTGGGRKVDPSNGLLDGLSRTLRRERYGLHLVSLGLDPSSRTRGKASLVMDIIKEMVSWYPHQPYEENYLEIDGTLHTQRLIESQYITSMMDELSNPLRFNSCSLSPDLRFEASTVPLNTGHDPYYTKLDPHLVLPSTGSCVEVRVKAALLRPANSVSVLESKESSIITRYCAGIISSTEHESSLDLGDRVICASTGSLRSHIQVPSQEVVSISPSQTFADACRALSITYPIYYSLVETAMVCADSSVLLHGIVGATGLATAAILVGRGVSDVWATASSTEESAWLSHNLQISPDRIIPGVWLRDDFMLAPELRRKFDIGFSADESTTPSSFTSCIKPRGRCVVLRRNTAVPQPGVSLHFMSEDIALTIIEVDKVPISHSNFRNAVAISTRLTLDEEQSAAVFQSSQLPAAIEHMRKATHLNAVIEFSEGDTIKPKTTLRLDTNATYLVVGAFGGLGSTIVGWLVDRGARHLLLLSRSGPKSPEALDLLKDLRSRCIDVEAPCCDVSSGAMLQSTLAAYKTMPPIKGFYLCLPRANLWKETVFENMTFSQWNAVIESKAKASWNLHAQLPDNLDFFILTSSAMGILGSSSLAGYNAGNAFQDALAQYRVSQGRCAVSLVLGGIKDAGYLARHQQAMDLIANDKKLVMMTMDQVRTLLDIYCDPKSTPSSLSCQPIFGIIPPSYWENNIEVPPTMAQPFWNHMHHLPATDWEDSQGRKSEENMASDDARMAQSARVVDIASRLTAVETSEEAVSLISDAIVQRVSALLGITSDRVAAHRPLHTYGIDSLSAIDIRNWVKKVFDVDMPLFELLGGATFISVAASIAKKL
ncbi:putative polyketide synthase [Hypoxylon cercidicola]|nr:putative polyketide synthase [Hypoxylon cercidicola]